MVTAHLDVRPDVHPDGSGPESRPSAGEALQFYAFAGASVVLTVLLLAALVWNGIRA